MTALENIRAVCRNASRHRPAWLWLLAAWLALTAQAFASHSIDWQAFGAGGGASQSSLYQLTTVLGQPGPPAAAGSSSYVLQSGFPSLVPVLNLPVAHPDSLIVPLGGPYKIAVSRLLANDAEPNGDSLSVENAGTLTGTLGVLELMEDWIIYTPPEGTPVSDSFSYRINDGNGNLSTSTVTLGFLPALPGEQNTRLQITVDPGTGDVLIRFLGIPGRSYDIQGRADAGASWEVLGTVVADTLGLYTFTDSAPPSPGTRLYRSLEH